MFQPIRFVLRESHSNRIMFGTYMVYIRPFRRRLIVDIPTFGETMQRIPLLTSVAVIFEIPEPR